MELSIDADTAERLARGVLSFIALIAWCRWRGTTDDEKESKERRERRQKSKHNPSAHDGAPQGTTWVGDFLK